MNRSGYFKLLFVLMLAASVVLFSSKAGGYALTAGLERTVTPLAVPAGTAAAAQAIVVLTGGHWRNLEAVRLQRATGLPVLASGGDGEAAAIKGQLERDFGVPVRWTEDDSLTTEENALFSAKILAGARVHKILLVTHALHMPRAYRLFSDTGLEVIAAPTDFSSTVTLRWTDFWPSAEGRITSQSALHEIVGLAWYRLRQVLAFANLLAGHHIHFSAQSGDQGTRSTPLASQINAGNAMLRGAWHDDFMAQCRLFPNGTYDDQAAARGFNAPLRPQTGIFT